MLATNDMDSILKHKRYNDRKYSLLNKATSDHLISPSAAIWAHEVRLESNDERDILRIRLIYQEKFKIGVFFNFL